MQLIIKGGTVVTPLETFEADLGVDGGKIVAIAKTLSAREAQVIDANGLYVLPGAIDAHTHLEMPFGGTVSADGYESGTRAAVCGGVTTVFDYAIQRSGKGIVQTVKERQALAEHAAYCDYAFHCAVTDIGNGFELLEEFPAAVDYGVTSLKCFMVYRKEGMMINDGMLLAVLAKAREAGILTNVHAENPDVIDARTALFRSQGNLSPWYHYLSRPEFVEAEAVHRAIYWAKMAEAPLYIVHLACEEGVRAVAEAKAQGLPIYAETCPQYLAFNADVYRRDDGRNFVCSPPVKGEASRLALWRAINDGVIDTVATDHCPFQQAEKDWGISDYTRIPNGCAGIENLYPYMLSAANQGHISFNKVVDICAYKPAHLFGCPTKGLLSVGRDADIVLYDPKQSFRIDVNRMHSDCDHTIWQGTELSGYPVMTFVRGTLVFDHGNITGLPGFGRYLKRRKFTGN
jgi:dihydropyrimidinase